VCGVCPRYRTVIEMMSLLILTVFLALFLGIFDKIFGRRTPREVLRMRQRSGALSDEAWNSLQEFEKQFGTPIALIAPVLSALDTRLDSFTRLTPSAYASQRLATIEQAGAMERDLQRQAQAMQASGFRGNSLARAMLGARMGTMMNKERMLADLAMQEQLLDRKERMTEQQLRESVAQDRFNLLMSLRSGLQEQAVKGGSLAMQSALQGEQLASQQMMGLMQGIGSLAGAYAQYRQNQEMLRTMQGLFQQRGASPTPSAPASPPVSLPFFNPASRIVF